MKRSPYIQTAPASHCKHTGNVFAMGATLTLNIAASTAPILSDLIPGNVYSVRITFLPSLHMWYVQERLAGKKFVKEGMKVRFLQEGTHGGPARGPVADAAAFFTQGPSA